MAGTKPSDNPRINKLIELEVSGRIKPEHQMELDTYRAQGIAPKKSTGSATESERTAAFLGTRVAGAMGTLGEIDKTDPDAAKPLLRTEVARMLTPERFEEAAANSVTPEPRQRVEAAQLELLDAALTLGTGAAYTREQLEGYRRSYFPQMGDDPKTIEDKRQRLKVVLEAAKVKAGAAAPSIDQALAKAYGGAEQPSTMTADAPTLGSGNLIEDAVEAAAGPTKAEDMAAFETEFRDAYTKGADKAALLAIAAKYGRTANEKEVDAALAARAAGDTRLNLTTPPQPPVGPPPGRGEGGIGETLNAGVRGAADTLTLGLRDEINALEATLLDPDSTLRDNLDRERAIDRYDEENNFGARLTGQIAGGFALPLGAARTPAALGRTAAGYSAAYGFGSGEGVADRFGGAAVGGITGGSLGFLAGRAGQALGRRIPRGGTSSGVSAPQALVEAADRQGIDVLPADAGGPMTRRLTGAAMQAPVSAVPITAASERVTEQALGARDRIAAGVGQVVEPELAGETARSGARSFISRTSSRGGDLYRTAERMAGTSRVIPVKALDVLDQNIAELSQVPGGGDGVAALQALRDELGKMGTVSVAGIRGMRTSLRDRFIKDGLRGSDLERRVDQVINAASADLVDSLTAAGKPQAARAFAVADRYWRSRLTTIDETLEPIIGKGGDKSGEQVVAALQQASKGNAKRLASFIRALPPEESAVVRATMIAQLGRATAGTQGAAGNSFSLAQFLTHWNQMTPGAKRALFDPASMSALNDLAIIAEGAKAAGRYANSSNTAGGVIGQAVISGGLGAIFDFGTMAAALASQYGAGRLLASPRFARWLARAPKQRDPLKHIESLRDIAAKETAIAPELLGFQQRLTEALQQEPARLAAADENNE